jgi:N-acetylglucosamine-6-phosphate deacetylase
MTPSNHISGHVVTPEGTVDGVVRWDAGVIERVEPVGDVPARWVVPGFIDLQLNGAGGIDVTTQPDRLAELAADLPRHGVTAFLPTVITCLPAVRARALHAPLPDDAGAVPLGLHLEGPMLSPARIGAHPADLLAPPSDELIEGWAAPRVRLVTIAPELPGALDVIAALTGRGVVVAVGHTDASADEFAAARRAGARYVTHLFNAMRPFAHRDPGPIGATLVDDDVVAGLICDGVHVDPVVVRLAWRALGPGRLNLVTDAVAGAMRNAAGILAGSSLSLDQAVRNLVAFTGCAVADAIATVTSTPADLLGLAGRGRLVPGARADVTVLDTDLRVVETYVGGELAWRS